MTIVRGLAPADLAKLSFHDPAKAPRPPAGGGGSGPSPDIAALVGYAGPSMSDPSLMRRLTDLDLPVQLIWGQSDGIVSPGYGKALPTRSRFPRSPCYRAAATCPNWKHPKNFSAPSPTSTTDPQLAEMRNRHGHMVTVTRIAHPCQLIEIGGLPLSPTLIRLKPLPSGRTDQLPVSGHYGQMAVKFGFG